MMVISFTKPILCFAPRTFTRIIKPISIKKNKARINGFANTGNITANESAITFINAALPKILHPKKYNQLTI